MGKSKKKVMHSRKEEQQAKESIADYRSCRFGIGSCHVGRLFLLGLIKDKYAAGDRTEVSRKRRV